MNTFTTYHYINYYINLRDVYTVILHARKWASDRPGLPTKFDMIIITTIYTICSYSRIVTGYA